MTKDQMIIFNYMTIPKMSKNGVRAGCGGGPDIGYKS